jgi:hypothetical protein
MVYYVIKLDHGIYFGNRGPYGELETSTTSAGAARFKRKKNAKEYAVLRGFGTSTIERIEVTNGC